MKYASRTLRVGSKEHTKGPFQQRILSSCCGRTPRGSGAMSSAYVLCSRWRRVGSSYRFRYRSSHSRMISNRITRCPGLPDRDSS